MDQIEDLRDSPLLQEYAIVHQELSRCSHIFWTQAEFFLTLSTAMLGFAGYMLSVSQYWIAIILSIGGLLIAIIWLLHGNRIGVYVRATEERIRAVEKLHEDQLFFHVKMTQKSVLDNPRDLRLLERTRSSGLVRTGLPGLICGLWGLALCLSIVLLILSS